MNTDIVLYGIPNCDTVKRARADFAAAEVAYRFHDFKKAGLPEGEVLAEWFAQCGWERLVNRQGSTWRQLGEADKAAVADEASAAALMRAQPSVVKRPVIRWGDGAVTVGWGADAQGRLPRG
jgi:arsenate reductase